MKISIRTRLTLWYVTLLAVSLIVFSMSFFYALSAVFIDSIDEQIDPVAAMMEHTVVQPPGVLRLPRNFDSIYEMFFGIRTTGIYIQVRDASGRVKGRSSSLEGFTLPLSDKARAAVEADETIHEIVDTVGSYPVRVVMKPVVLRDFGLVAIIQVGASLEGRERIFHYMVYFFVVGTVVSLIIASVVGWFLAVKALSPVDEITRMAREISADRLDERLSIKGPEDELTRLAGVLNEMIARLEGSFMQIKQFTGDASHDLKTPLTVMKGEIEVALRAESSVEQLEGVLTSCLEEIDRMSYIVKNLLDLAREDARVVDEHRVDVRLDKVLADRYEQFRRVAVEAGVELDLSMNARATVHGDEVRLGQLIYNLIDNAVKYTPRGGKVVLSLVDDAADGSVIFMVTDTGVGIDEEDIPYIFDRFYRVDKSRSRSGGGVGLGLSICKEVAENHDGFIGVESERDRGTTFIVRLPTVEGDGSG